MINEVILVGKINAISNLKENKREVLLEVERPFKEVEGRSSDVFSCQLWNSIFNKVLSFCSIGDLLAIKGRIVKDKNNQYLIMAENVVMLNKSKKKV